MLRQPEAEAKLVLVGDPGQLQPINAGTPLKDMVDQISAVELTEIRRQKVDWQRQASLDLAQDRTQDAIDKYDIHDAVHHAQDNAAAVARLVNDYLKDANENGKSASRLALAHRRIDVHTINQSIRTTRQQKGELLNEQLFNTIYGPRKFAAGDRIVFTRNNKELGLKNGTLGTIEHTSQNRLTVRLDAGGGHPERILSFKPSQYPFIDHGYATTIHKSQGATVDRTFVLGSRRMDRHLTYVALTRHRQNTNLYLDQQSMPKCIQHEPQADFDLQEFNRKNQYTYSMS